MGASRVNRFTSRASIRSAGFRRDGKSSAQQGRQLESGHTPSRSREDLWVNAENPWITLDYFGTLAGSEFISETKNLISDAGLAASSARMLPAHTVVLSRDATIGRVGIMATSMATSQHFAAWVCTSALRPRFLWLLLRYAMQPFLASFDDGASIHDGMPHVRRFVVPLPPVEHQDRLSRSLRSDELRCNQRVTFWPASSGSSQSIDGP